MITDMKQPAEAWLAEVLHEMAKNGIGNEVLSMEFEISGRFFVFKLERLCPVAF